MMAKRDHTRRVRLCGIQLANAMKLACSGFRGKRSTDRNTVLIKFSNEKLIRCFI